MREMDQRACDLQRAEEGCRKAIDVATKDYNQALVSLWVQSILKLFELSLFCLCKLAFLAETYSPSENK